jgi:hypothetical protein
MIDDMVRRFWPRPQNQLLTAHTDPIREGVRSLLRHISPRGRDGSHRTDVAAHELEAHPQPAPELVDVRLLSLPSFCPALTLGSQVGNDEPDRRVRYAARADRDAPAAAQSVRRAEQPRVEQRGRAHRQGTERAPVPLAPSADGRRRWSSRTTFTLSSLWSVRIAFQRLAAHH